MFDDFYPAGGIQLYKPEALIEGTPVLLDERPSISVDGFDEVVRRMLLRAPMDTVRAAINQYFPRGQRLGTENLWIRKATGKCLAAQLFEIEATSYGRIGDLRYERKVDAQAQSTSGTDITIGATYPTGYPAGAVSIQGIEASLVCRTRYVTTTAPDFTEVSEATTGSAAAPAPLPAGYPALPSGPSNKWTGLATPIWIVPAGWVLETRNTDAIRDTTGAEVCWQIEDVHVYYHQQRPS